jgi:hypothetical protein
MRGDLVIGPFLLYEDEHGHIVKAIARTRDEVKDPITLIRFVPRRHLVGPGHQWFPVHGGEEVAVPVRSKVELRQTRQIELIHKYDSDAWTAKCTELRGIVRGLANGGQLRAVGLELLDCDESGEARTDRELVQLAGVDNREVWRLKRTLGQVAPTLFPSLVDHRGAALAASFASLGDVWHDEVLGLEKCSRGEAEFLLGRELLAGRLEVRRGDMPSLDALAQRSGVDAEVVKNLFSVVRNRDTKRALEREFEAAGRDWSKESGKLPADLSGGLFDVAGELLLGRLRDVAVSDGFIADVTGILRRTVCRHRLAVWDDVGKIIKPVVAVDEAPRRGRPPKRA